MHRTTLLLAIACLVPAARAETPPESSPLYDVRFEATRSLEKGAKGTVMARIVPRAGAHLSEEAPVSLGLVAPDAIALAKSKATKADVKFKDGGGTIEVPFTAVQTGSTKIDARLKFYICTDRTCAQQEKTASLPVTVR
jgi:hypothetical protein